MAAVVSECALEVAASVRLPEEQAEGTLALGASFAAAWPESHAIAALLEPGELPCGDCLLLHGRSREAPLLLLDASTGHVAMQELKAGPTEPFAAVARTPGNGFPLFLATFEALPVLAVWTQAGQLVTLVDLAAPADGLRPIQVAVHPTRACAAVEFWDDEETAETRLLCWD